jgi:hypothetical protein
MGMVCELGVGRTALGACTKVERGGTALMGMSCELGVSIAVGSVDGMTGLRLGVDTR